MRIFLVKILVLMLALSLSNVGWAGHHPPKASHTSVSIVVEKTSPSIIETKSSFFDMNPLLSFAMGLNIHLDFSVSFSSLNLQKPPLAPMLPLTSQNWDWTQNQSNCTPVKPIPPMKEWFSGQPNCTASKHEPPKVQAKPAKPKPPMVEPKPIKSKPVMVAPTSQPIDLSNNPHCDLTKSDVRWGHFRPFKHDFFSSNPSCVQQLIIPDQKKCVYYPGDMIRIDLKLTKELKAAVKSKVEGYVLVAPPEGDIITIPVDIDMLDERHRLVELANLDTSDFAEGNYQLAFVLTELDGDPADINDWHRGFKGLISTARVKIRAGYQYDAEDSDGNGMIDCDLNGDGFCEFLSNFHHRRGIRFFFGKPACKKDIIIPYPAKHVYYQGDPIGLYLDFPDSLKTVAKGNADAYVLVAPPIGDFFVIPVDINEGDKLHKFFELANLDTSTFVKGDYQIGLVLTELGGDPLNVEDWYRDFRGLVSITRIKISAGCDTEDTNGDGKVDGDTDNDGFSDELTEELTEEKFVEENPVDEKPVKKPVKKPESVKPINPADIDPRGNHIQSRPGQKQPAVLPKPVDTPETSKPADVPVTPQPVNVETPKPAEVPVTPPPVNVPVITPPIKTPATLPSVDTPPITPVILPPSDIPVVIQPVENPIVENPVVIEQQPIAEQALPELPAVEPPAIQQPLEGDEDTTDENAMDEDSEVDSQDENVNDDNFEDEDSQDEIVNDDNFEDEDSEDETVNNDDFDKNFGKGFYDEDIEE